MQSISDRTCVILAPFSNSFHAVYEQLLLSLNDLGVTTVWLGAGIDFAEKASPATRLKLESINLYLVSADLVIADVTGNSPNVMYELGIAHALRKPVLLIGKVDVGSKGVETALPIELRGFVVFWYEDSTIDSLNFYVRIWASNALARTSQAVAYEG